MNIFTKPVFYDCEASGLDGVPIEIGWAFCSSKSGDIESEGHLIRPPRHWDIESRWDPMAAALHRISIETLMADGRSPWDVARRMNDILRGRELYSDSPLDEHWLSMVFEESGVEPTFVVRQMNADLLIAQARMSRPRSTGDLQDVCNAELEHRAEADARRLAIKWRASL